jgi:hypothetical protein
LTANSHLFNTHHYQFDRCELQCSTTYLTCLTRMSLAPSRAATEPRSQLLGQAAELSKQAENKPIPWVPLSPYHHQYVR